MTVISMGTWTTERRTRFNPPGVSAAASATLLSHREQRLFAQWCERFGVDWQTLRGRQREDYIELWKDDTRVVPQ